MATGGVVSATGGVSGTQQPATCPLPLWSGGANPSIDDFEDGNGELETVDNRVGWWWVSDDGTAGTISPAPGTATNPSSPGRAGSNYAMHVSGFGFTGWGATLGVNLVMAISGSCPYDASAYQGVTFWAKGTGSTRLQLPTSATEDASFGGTCVTNCGDHYGAAVVLGTDWQQYSFRWADLAQDGFGTPVSFDPKTLLQLNIGWPANTQFDLWLDDVAFLTGPITTCPSGSNLCGGGCCSNSKVCVGGSCQVGCTIGSTPYASGAANPSGLCQTCQPNMSTTAWTISDGSICGCTSSFESVQPSTGLCVARMAAASAPNTSSNYTIDVTEVTKGQYDLWLAAKPALPLSTDANCGYVTSYAEQFTTGAYSGTDAAHHPVVYVDWCDAYAYCQGVGKRLCGAIGGGSNAYASYNDLTLSQWYRACTTAGTDAYPYANAYNATTCNGYDLWAPNYNYTTTAAGSLPGCHTPAGVYDQSGNVWEWEDSCNATGKTADCRIRGGAFHNFGVDLACNSNNDATRSYIDVSIGFRCCSP